jgi:N-acetylneuraminate lyase
MLTGLIAAPFTAMRSDGGVDFSSIDRYVRFLIRNDISGAYICGTTGEGLLLSVSERLMLAEKWVHASQGNLPIIVHVGHTSISESRTLAAHAKRIGADAITTMGPIFIKPDSLEKVVDFCGEVADAAPGLPFYYYHVPVQTGLPYSAFDFARLAAQRIPTFAGLKFTHEDLMDFRQCVLFENGRLNVLFGRDEMLLAALVFGAHGAVGSTYNFAAPLYHKIIEAHKAADMRTALTHQTQAIELVAIYKKYGLISAGKAIMKIIACDVGPVRSPLTNLSEGQYVELRRDLERIGFFDYCCKPPC